MARVKDGWDIEEEREMKRSELVEEFLRLSKLTGNRVQMDGPECGIPKNLEAARAAVRSRRQKLNFMRQAQAAETRHPKTPTG